VAYEGDAPVFATLVSTGIGRPGSALATPEGVFRLRSKHLAATMDNLEHTEVVPYSYEDIPLVQYFTERVALHAALWHQRFGHPASHGCVNLTPADAARLFSFTSPHLPAGDTEVWTRDQDATVVRVRRGP
jgi:lipoprotein-anchoring transpeptidase ErfK/SrfK